MVKKTVVTDHKTIQINCPECGRRNDKDVSKYLMMDQALQLKYTCPCGHSFSILLERRRTARKKVHFSGTLIFGKNQYAILVVDILVLDISRYGLNIKLLDLFDIEQGQKIRVEFKLDDNARSKVTKEAVVRNVRLPNIGVEFESHEHLDPFGAYILFYFNDP